MTNCYECPRCQTKSATVLLDTYGDPYLCDECWEND